MTGLGCLNHKLLVRTIVSKQGCINYSFPSSMRYLKKKIAPFEHFIEIFAHIVTTL